jgi:hypothetical protein
MIFVFFDFSQKAIHIMLIRDLPVHADNFPPAQEADSEPE